MDIKYGNGLEFETDDGQPAESDLLDISPAQEAALDHILRHGFRAPVGASEQISLSIGTSEYVVFNLSGRGVGIYLNHPGEITEYLHVNGMKLTIGGHSYSVDGEIKHLSNDGIHDLCGIELTSISSECQDAIIQYLQKSRNSLFVS